MPKKRILAIALTSLMPIPWTGAQAAGVTSVTNGLLKESESYSETITYENFRAGAYREVYDVPANIGALKAIVPSPDGGVTLWFEDQQGNLRNVELSDTKPLVIRRRGTLTVAP